MNAAQIAEFARRGEELYGERFRETLESTHRDYFVAIEPDSGSYFLGRTLEEAIAASRSAHPGKICYSLRVGHPVAVEIGAP